MLCLFAISLCFPVFSANAQTKQVLQLRYDHHFQSAGYYAALWNGYYQEAGIDLEIRPGLKPDGTLVDVSDELRSGNADYGVASTDALIARSNGIPLVLLASIFQQSGVEILARPEVKLLSPSDLTRVRLQGSLLGRADSELIAFLVAEGVDPSKVDLNGSGAQRTVKNSLEQLFAGEVDAVLTSSFSASWIARERGVAFTRMRPSSYSIDFYGDSLFTHQRDIDEDPDQVERFVEASLRGWQYAFDHPDEISRKISTAFPRVLPINNPDDYNMFLASKVRELAAFPIVELGHINKRRWRTMNDSLKNAGLVANDLDTERFIFSPKQVRAEKVQFRYTIAFMTLIGLAFVFVCFVVRSRLTRRREKNESLQLLRKSENRLRTIVETEPECVLVLTSDFNILEINSAGLEMLEADSVEELKVEGIRARVVPEYREAFEKFHQFVIAGNSGKHEYEIIGLKGTRRWMESHATVLSDESIGAMYLSITRDVTEQRRSGELLKTKDEQLRQMQKMDAIGRLAGGIAHDFNNLLTAINGYSELSLRSLPNGSPVHHNVEEIRRAGERAADLTRQLLAFSRKQIMKPKIINLNQTVADIKKMLERLIGEDIEIVTRLSPDLGQISADPGHIEQMIVNLVVNARDAMPDGGRLTIETSNISLDTEYAKRHFPIVPGKYIVIAITDTGLGMDKETQENIFEPFFTTKDIGRGTGLGLATVHGIVKQSGGDIWVYSEVGNGTTFKVYLPRVFDESEEPETSAAQIDEPRGTATILLVEDDELVSNITETILKTQGYNVLTASNGEDAISVCKEFPKKIDLLITDVIMPRMGGREVAERLKLLRQDLKILFISGYTENSIVQNDVLEENILFLEKPFSPNALVRKVREVLEL